MDPLDPLINPPFDSASYWRHEARLWELGCLVEQQLRAEQIREDFGLEDEIGKLVDQLYCDNARFPATFHEYTRHSKSTLQVWFESGSFDSGDVEHFPISIASIPLVNVAADVLDSHMGAVDAPQTRDSVPPAASPGLSSIDGYSSYSPSIDVPRPQPTTDFAAPLQTLSPALLTTPPFPTAKPVSGAGSGRTREENRARRSEPLLNRILQTQTFRVSLTEHTTTTACCIAGSTGALDGRGGLTASPTFTRQDVRKDTSP
ncbi:hypothetical protein DFH09DRAFT_1079756 [Mycena vulgaris]|nr:hypothetical protein DFH09DRAFT_1079756 [Mycena vulgaris]